MELAQDRDYPRTLVNMTLTYNFEEVCNSDLP